MGPVDLFLHLLGFVAPAFGLALAMASCARLFWPGKTSWFKAVLLDFAVGTAVLAAGLVIFGRDGKMATYAALVLAIATTHWLLARGWAR